VRPNDEEIRNLGLNIVLALREKDWTQQQLEAASGVPQPTISKIIRGKRDPSVSIVSRLAKALTKTIDELLSPPNRKKLRSAS